MANFPIAVRNLIAVHSLTIESRYKEAGKYSYGDPRSEVGRYDVLQRRGETDSNVHYRVIAVIDVKDSEAAIIQDILSGLEED